uniref:Uncharacterized protein n=1 Tax=Molossus molossus TaxID=27622 RepID=A0A7J8EDW6_MOLMO|nr:hypothetical protein HJG59_008805 [Molossus molossus]
MTVQHFQCQTGVRVALCVMPTTCHQVKISPPFSPFLLCLLLSAAAFRNGVRPPATKTHPQLSLHISQMKLRTQKPLSWRGELPGLGAFRRVPNEMLPAVFTGAILSQLSCGRWKIVWRNDWVQTGWDNRILEVGRRLTRWQEIMLHNMIEHTHTHTCAPKHTQYCHHLSVLNIQHLLGTIDSGNLNFQT